MKNVLKWDEATMATLITGCQVLGTICQAMAANVIPQFYLATFLMGAQLSIYSIARSQFTKCVHPDEVGKIFAAVAIIASVMQLAVSPLGKLLYNATISIYPGTFLLIMSGIFFIAFSLNGFLWFHRHEMQHKTESVIGDMPLETEGNRGFETKE